MRTSWREVELDDVATELTVGHVGPMVTEYRDRGIPFIRSTDIEPFRINRSELKFINPDFHAKLKKSALRPGDVVIVRTGKPGTAAVIPEELPDANCSDVVIVRTAPELDPHYLVYYVNSSGRAHVNAHSGGAVQQHFNVGAARRIRINLPPLQEQREIVDVLGALDDKIELNRRMNATLEAMAQAVFKEWFVDGAKEEWVEKSIGDLAEVVGGATPSTKEEAFWNGAHRWATPKDLSRLQVPVLLDTERHLTDAGLAEIGSGLLPVGTVLMSSRAPIGYIAVAEVPTAVNQGFIAMKPKPGVSNLYLWQWAKQSMDQIKSMANGSTFLEISKASFRPIPVRVPPTERMKAYDDLVRPMYERLVANEREIGTLTVMRDTLLPKLMRGEIRVMQ